MNLGSTTIWVLINLGLTTKNWSRFPTAIASYKITQSASKECVLDRSSAPVLYVADNRNYIRTATKIVRPADNQPQETKRPRR
jgi:hypothetical protein